MKYIIAYKQKFMPGFRMWNTEEQALDDFFKRVEPHIYFDADRARQLLAERGFEVRAVDVD